MMRPPDCPEHPRRRDITLIGNGVFAGGIYAGHIEPTLIGGKQVWRAVRADGEPVAGNAVRESREAAAWLLAGVVGHG